MAEQSLRCRWVYQGDGYPAALAVPPAEGGQRVHVGMPSQVVYTVLGGEIPYHHPELAAE